MAFWNVDERVPVPQSVEVETARMAGFAWGVATATSMLIRNVPRAEDGVPVEEFHDDRQRSEHRGGVKPPRNRDSFKKKKEQTKPLDKKMMGHRRKMPGQDARNCYLCGQPGHIRRDCPRHIQQKMQERKAVMCGKCGKIGHVASVCRHCFQCGQPGHISRRCPQKVQQDEAQLGQTEHPPHTQWVQLQMQQVDESRNDWMVLDPSTSSTGV